MVKKIDIQRFIIWLSGSVAVFGFIATLVAYLIYGGSSTNCSQESSNPSCQNNNTVVTEQDNTILKIIGPVFIVAGIVAIILVRCWQNSSQQTVDTNVTANANGENNGGFERTEFDFGCPPSYSEAIHMRIVVEGQVNFPSEPPPKYDDALASIEEEPPGTGTTTADVIQGPSSSSTDHSRTENSSLHDVEVVAGTTNSQDSTNERQTDTCDNISGDVDNDSDNMDNDDNDDAGNHDSHAEDSQQTIVQSSARRSSTVDLNSERTSQDNSPHMTTPGSDEQIRDEAAINDSNEAT